MVKVMHWHDESVTNNVIKIMQSGDLIVSTTDTVFGLLAPATQQGFDKLNAIKQRYDKPYLILISDISKLPLFADVPHNATLQKIMDRYWPGPLTIILPAKNNLPEFMQSKNNTVAIRVPDHAGLQKVLAHFDGLFSTSANLAGEPVPETVDQLSDAIKNKVRMLVLDKQPKDAAVASTIIDATSDDIQVIRQGAITLSN